MTQTSAEHGDIRQSLATAINQGHWMELAETLGYDTTGSFSIPASTYDIWGLAPKTVEEFEDLALLSSEPGFRLLLVRGCAPYRAFRSLITSLEKRNAEDTTLWWWDRGDTAIAATPKRADSGRIRVRTIEISRQSPEPVALEAWARLERGRAVRVDKADGADAMRRHLAEAFEHREITRSFFRGFSAALTRLIETLEAGPDDERQRHDISLSALLRMVFVYFLQRRGMLDGDAAFVLRHLRRCASGDISFVANVLKPLYFGALNRPQASRRKLAADLGDLPFLNGGLFEPLPIEEEFPDFTWPNAVWVDIIEELFERYHFAVSETQPDDARSAVDPEMLGRVFEGLMYGAARHESGSFYTPRDVVRSMVEDALAGHIVDRTELGDDAASALVRGESLDWPEDTVDEIRGALDEVTILDPAVGTGAFLLEALHALRRCWSALGAPEPSESMGAYRHVRSLIHRHLFGVDIQHTAVRLCELRLWLALLATMPDLTTEEIPPLPNLAHKVCAGNSLLAPLDLVQLRAGASKTSEANWGLGATRDVSESYVEKTRALQERWLTAHGDEKRQVRTQLDDTVRDMQLDLLNARRRKLAQKLEPFDKLASSEDLFGDDVALDAAQQSEACALRRQVEALGAARDDLRAGRASGLAFSYAARFSGVLDAGGFDIVVTNPPWVRASRIDDSLKDLLKRRYRSHSNSLWEGAEDLGIRAPFGAQTDLAALFLERSLELLAPGGHLCALVPAKLFRSLHGAALRQQIMEHDLLRLEDHSDAERQMFDATVYPAVLHARKVACERLVSRRDRRSGRRRAPRKLGTTPAVEVTTWRGRRASSWSASKRSLPAIEDTPGAPWLLLDADVSQVIDEVRARSVPMGSVETLQPCRGFFTGCNRVFLTNEEQARRRLGGDWTQWTRRVARGRDCRAWEVSASDLVWWGYDARMDAIEEVPGAFRTFFEEHRTQLESRSDHRQGQPLWQLFRLKQGLAQPKVLWRDLSPKLEAAFADPEVVPLNTVYFVPFEQPEQARTFEALLNSEPVRAVAYALGERARGGWRRHFSWVMRMLPVPECVAEAIDDTSALDNLLTTEELAVLDGTSVAGKQAVADELGRRWFGLDSADIERLRHWRCGADAPSPLEVAA